MARKTPELTQQSIHDASTAEIAAFALANAGLKFEEGADRQWMIESVYEAMGWDAYSPDKDATHVIIKLPLSKTEKHPYRGGFNGKMFTIKRGEPVKIPIGYYNTMIESAVQRYSLSNVPENGEIQEGSPASRRIPLGELDIQVIKFIKEGKVTKTNETSETTEEPSED